MSIDYFFILLQLKSIAMAKKTDYRQILAEIRQEIKDKIPSGTLMPTESELASLYKVSRPTIAKVYNILQEEGYVIKKPGIGTTVVFSEAQNKYKFGLLLPGPGESEIFEIIEERFTELSQKKTFSCLWNGVASGNAYIRKELTEKYCEEYIREKVDGVFFAPLERISNAEEFNCSICRKFSDANIPVILIDRDIVNYPSRSDYDMVSLDNLNAAFEVASHIISAGCTKILFIYRPHSAESVKTRIYGIAAAALTHGIPFTQHDVCCGNPEDTDFIKGLKIDKGNTGIICANDSTAAVLMTTLSANDINITSDVLLCGFDNMKYDEHLKSPLTSYRQPCIEITDTAVELMLRRISNPKAATLTINLRGELCIRGSSKKLK